MCVCMYGCVYVCMRGEKGVGHPYLERERGPSGLQQIPRDNVAQHTRQGARPSATDANSQSLAEVSET